MSLNVAELLANSGIQPNEKPPERRSPPDPAHASAEARARLKAAIAARQEAEESLQKIQQPADELHRRIRAAQAELACLGDREVQIGEPLREWVQSGCQGPEPTLDAAAVGDIALRRQNLTVLLTALTAGKPSLDAEVQAAGTRLQAAQKSVMQAAQQVLMAEAASALTQIDQLTRDRCNLLARVGGIALAMRMADRDFTQDATVLHRALTNRNQTFAPSDSEITRHQSLFAGLLRDLQTNADAIITEDSSHE
jgi:hypothetical protein